jgi:hypothetical protein
MGWTEFSLTITTLALATTSAAASRDYADSRNAAAWLRHPVYGDPSFDSFERVPGNPLHRGSAPFEWPVNGFLFLDPVSANWYIYVGDYGKGYVTPPSRCLLYRSTDTGGTWINLGVVLKGDPKMFDRDGHTPDVSVVYADHRYHMVYDWGEANFNAEGGLAYAWAERPEGPWHRAPEPLTRNTTLPKLLGRYQRTYAATLLRRSHDWLILAMMDHAPRGWALFAMTSPKPEGAYSERRLVRNVEADYFHPPLMEFFPAFVHKGFVYAPATSVALNRNFNAIFRAPLERADDPSAWTVFQHGSVWHSEDFENEHYGIWGQTFSGAVDGQGNLHVMFPSRDSQGRGTINLARRPWRQPLRKRGFVLTGHGGPSLTLLRDAYDDFNLEMRFQLRGTARLLLDYAAPLLPNVPSSEATLHPIMNTRHTAIEFAPGAWRLLRLDAAGKEAVLASGSLSAAEKSAMQVNRSGSLLVLSANHRPVWEGSLPTERAAEPVGAMGLRVEKNTHLLVEEFQIRGKASPARITFGAAEALLGAAEAPADWEERRDAAFRFGLGATSRKSAAWAKWNVIGSRLQLWSPRGPQFGKVELRLDGQPAASLSLHAERLEASRVVWQSPKLQNSFHALVLDSTGGLLPLDSVDAFAGNGGSR